MVVDDSCVWPAVHGIVMRKDSMPSVRDSVASDAGKPAAGAHFGESSATPTRKPAPAAWPLAAARQTSTAAAAATGPAKVRPLLPNAPRAYAVQEVGSMGRSDYSQGAQVLLPAVPAVRYKRNEPGFPDSRLAPVG